MAIATDSIASRQYQLTTSRVFKAPRALVFSAWSAAEHVRNWFCPEHFTVPQACVEFRVGGRFDVCMRAPDGSEHWTRGFFLEIVPQARLVIDMTVPGPDGQPLFAARTEVGFRDEDGGTRMDVRQDYTLFAPIAEQMVKGAEEGWRQTLDRLGRQLARMAEGAAPQRSVVHGSFRVERHYPASPQRVFRAFTDPQAKATWFGGGTDQQILVREMDVRPGGRERVQGKWSSGMVSTFDAVYFDVVPDERIVYTYEMHLDERKISVSLASIELKAEAGGTRVVVVEHGAFLDGYEDGGSREHGTNWLLDKLGASLQQ